ncbi:hypothetical protein [Nocardioides sp.]|uniref:hypothetical protein n=1 Tax=Nocardioides sp. TaxID=35761 RepID=UPI0039E3717C
MRPKLSTVIALIAVIVLTSVGTATAAGVINGKNIKKNSIPLSALNKNAIAALRGATGPAGPAGAQGPAGAAGSVNRYWAAIDENGSVVKQSGGITASHVTNGSQSAKTRVTFPADLSDCFWGATTSDAVNPLGGSEMTIPRLIGVGRSSLGGNVLEVTMTDPNLTLVWDAFEIVAIC